MHAVAGRGWTAVFMHFRGCSGPPNRLRRIYHSGDTDGLRFLLSILARRFPRRKIAVVGYSIGGNVLLKYLGESGSRSRVSAAAAISVPFDLAACAERMESGFSRIYQRHLLRSLHRKLRIKYGDDSPVPAARIPALDTFRKFDDAVTAPLHGFTDAADYYHRSSSRQYLSRIQVPALIIQARDDPFFPPDFLPDERELSDCITLDLNPRGGHVGFVSGNIPLRPRYWLEKRITGFLGIHLE